MRDPEQYEAILADSAEFEMASDKTTGQWLRAMAASKGNGRFLDLGTGTGLSACWILDGMDAGSTLLTVDDDPEVMEKWIEAATDHGINTFIFDWYWFDEGPFLESALDIIVVKGLQFCDTMLHSRECGPGGRRAQR